MMKHSGACIGMAGVLCIVCCVSGRVLAGGGRVTPRGDTHPWHNGVVVGVAGQAAGHQVQRHEVRKVVHASVHPTLAGTTNAAEHRSVRPW